MPAAPATPPEPAARPAPDRLRFTPFSLLRAGVIVAVGLVVLRVVIAAGTVIWWLAIGSVVAALLLSSVSFLQRWLPRGAAIIAVIVILLGVFGAIGYRGWAELSAQYDTLQTDAVNAASDIESSDQFGQVAREFGLVDKTRQFFSSVPVAIGAGGGGGDAAAAVQTAASNGGALFSVGMFTLLMLIFAPQFVRAGLNQIDDETVRGRVSELVIAAYHRTARYSGLMVGRAVVIGVAGALVCLALGMETPTALGVMFAVLSIIPGLGIVLAVLPIAVFEAIHSVPTALLLILSAIIIQALEVTFVQKRIDDASVHVGPAPTIIAALLGLQLYGIGGALVALAITAYGLAMLRGLTRSNDELLDAMRELVAEDEVDSATPGLAPAGSSDATAARSSGVAGASPGSVEPTA
jgi:predicted PurR-regulated permease PerM